MLVSKGYDLYAKKDVQFLQTICRLLPREFTIRPALTPEQFFTTGYFEAKVELLITCGNLVKAHMPQRKRVERRKAKPSEQNEEIEYEGPETESNEESESHRPFDLARPNRPDFEIHEEHEGSQYGQGSAYDYHTVSNKTSHQDRHLMPLNRGYENEEEFDRPQYPSNKPRADGFHQIERPDTSGGVVMDSKDKVIEDQRRYIQELKSLILITNENVQLLTTKLSQFSSDVSIKIESLEARVKLLEAVSTIQRDSSPVFGIDD